MARGNWFSQSGLSDLEFLSEDLHELGADRPWLPSGVLESGFKSEDLTNFLVSYLGLLDHSGEHRELSLVGLRHHEGLLDRLKLANDPHPSLFRRPDLDEGVLEWTLGLLAVLAEVVVHQVGALESDTDDWLTVAAIADNTRVDNSILLSLPRCQVLGEELLVLGCAVLADLGLEDLVEIPEELVVELSSGVALLAREALLVDHGAIASEAVGEIVRVATLFDLVHVLWPQDHAADVLVVPDHVLLAGLRLRRVLEGVALGFLVESLGL